MLEDSFTHCRLIRAEFRGAFGGMTLGWMSIKTVMKSKKDWHKLNVGKTESRQREQEPPSGKKPPAQTDFPGGSRQGNAGMEKDADGAHR